MKLIAALALPLLITMSGGHKAPYTLVVDGVDDLLDCTLNDSAVAHYTFGQSGVTALTTKAGPNTLVCTPKDTTPSANHACWAFKFRLFKGWDEIEKVYSSCCTPGCPTQPAPVRIDFEAN